MKPPPPLLSAILEILGQNNKPIVFLEEGVRTGGVGMTLYDAIHSNPAMKDRAYTTLAIDSFGEGKWGESIYRTLGISAEDVVDLFKKS